MLLLAQKWCSWLGNTLFKSTYCFLKPIHPALGNILFESIRHCICGFCVIGHIRHLVYTVGALSVCSPRYSIGGVCINVYWLGIGTIVDLNYL